MHRWVDSIGLKPIFHGTHSMRRTKVSQIYRKTGNLRAVQLLLGHTKLESTVRYLGIEVDDARHIAEQIELPIVEIPTYPRRPLVAPEAAPRSMREGHSGLVLSPWLPGIERSQAGPEFARCRRSSRTPERREPRGRIGKGRSRQASQARPRRLSATVANSWSQWVPSSHRRCMAMATPLLGSLGRRKA